MTSSHFDPELIAALRGGQEIVLLTGAGVSAESGVPTFRDALTGLWRNFDAELLATSEAFKRDPDLVWGWYEWRRSKVLAAQPNDAHLAIAHLANLVPRLSLFTQNVDDLHERAGSADVQHLHGSLQDPRCFDCGHPFSFPRDAAQMSDDGRRLAPPVCEECGGLVRPGVVWFNELLPEKILDRANESFRSCDLLVVVGTSGLVYPVAELPNVAKKAGRKIIQINSCKSNLDSLCTWNLMGTAGSLLPELVSRAFS